MLKIHICIGEGGGSCFDFTSRLKIYKFHRRNFSNLKRCVIKLFSITNFVQTSNVQEEKKRRCEKSLNWYGVVINLNRYGTMFSQILKQDTTFDCHMKISLWSAKGGSYSKFLGKADNLIWGDLVFYGGLDNP